MTALVGIGSAVLRVIGLNPQRIGLQSEGRVAGRPTWGGMDYQTTGLGERTTPLEAVTFPHVTGGLDAVAWLLLHHEQQATVNYLRLESNYLGRLQGRVIIRNIFLDEDRLHPFTGVGRVVRVSLDLLHVGAPA